ncbi:hypothetical protein QFZ31_000032 [Neobacillus niacini]|nr:hypothetical protein [Neobacillus niacini]
MLRNGKLNLFPLKSLYDNPVVQIAKHSRRNFEMKSFKTWLVATMSVLMLLGVATGCADTGNDETETEETEQNEKGTEEGTENTEE